LKSPSSFSDGRLFWSGEHADSGRDLRTRINEFGFGKENRMVRKELEDRIINFSVSIVDISEEMPNNRAGNRLADQLIRSGTSPALNYGEAQSAESRKDFIHKIKVVLKELRETYVCLKIIHRSRLKVPRDKIVKIIKENDELISIFVKSVETARKKQSIRKQFIF
jgi:four helix bundle protein